MASNSIPYFPEFEAYSDNASARWKRWLSRFKNMMIAMNVDDNDARQRALLLHYAGEQVYDIFETLTDTGESDDFDKACEKLKAYFSPKKNIEYEVYVFRKEKQVIGETLDTYHTRLRRLAATCDFTDIDREIKTQIVQNCSSCRLRRRALRDADFSLSAMLAEGRAIELSEKQATDIENIREAEVNIASKRFQKTTTQRSQFKKATSNSTVNRENSTCYCCGGKYPHPQNKPCAAKGKICNYCQKSGHFAKVCKAKMHNNSMQTNCVTNTNAVTTTNVTSDSDDGYVFSAKNEAIVHNSLPTCVVQIEGEPIRMTIDSGASVNIMDSNTFNKIRRPSNMLFKQPVSKVYPYGSRTPLPVIGVFITKVKFHSKVVDTHVHVVEGTTGNLLGCQTAQDLGILHITQNVTARQYVTTSDTPQSQIIDQFAYLFEGAGKVDGVEIKLHIDHDVSPKQQQHRRISFHIRRDVENELDRLDKLDIIERASVKGKFPDYGVGDIAKELGKRWGVCTEKPKFEAMAVKDKARYAKAMEIYTRRLAWRRGQRPVRRRLRRQARPPRSPSRRHRRMMTTMMTRMMKMMKNQR